ncbi:hypothetical protein [Pseudoxanthomonas wuyuanensis]|uniref:hypothetical protein n=1 Tax=Pseudoxanthomonas wuyuanensis TaxID=1073196 RepID=UPI0013898BDB|nr:hypothetical protein [Pseudoxanthomonas wuyuanensis]
MLRIDADALQVRPDELQHRLQIAEESALPTLDVLYRAAPFGDCGITIATFAPHADDENGGAVFKQGHLGAPAADSRATLRRGHHRRITRESRRTHSRRLNV